MRRAVHTLLYNDDVLVPGIMKAFGVDCQRAESYVPLGCGEIEFDHYSFGTPSGAINVLKVLEITMHGGYDPVSGKRFGPATKTLAECETFEEFYEEYTKQLDYYIAAQAEFEMYEYQKTGEIHSFMYVTMLYDGCCEKAKPYLTEAAQAWAHWRYGLVNAGDSLTAIKKLIYEDKVLTLT